MQHDPVVSCTLMILYKNQHKCTGKVTKRDTHEVATFLHYSKNDFAVSLYFLPFSVTRLSCRVRLVTGVEDIAREARSGCAALVTMIVGDRYSDVDAFSDIKPEIREA